MMAVAVTMCTVELVVVLLSRPVLYLDTDMVPTLVLGHEHHLSGILQILPT